MLAPVGPVYQAGTLSGNPLAVTAGLVMLEEISKPDFYTKLTTQTDKLLTGLKALADAANIPFSCTQVGGMFGCFFSSEETIQTYEQVMKSDVATFQKYYHLMLSKGVYLAPSAYEAGFMSAAHGDEEIEKTLKAAESAFAQLRS
jgi:glutamate-1-semialdehyde 2,1-aminomutase